MPKTTAEAGWRRGAGTAIRAIGGISTLCGWIAAAMILASVLITCQMIFVRFMLRQSTIWQTETVIYLMIAATMLGLPYAFASHFAPDQLGEAVEIYRQRFEPSEALQTPHVMVGVMAAVADTDQAAAHLFTSAQQQFVNLRRNVRRPFPRPVDSMDGFWSEMERIGVEHTLRYAIVGSPETAGRKLDALIAEVAPDEVIVSTPIHDLDARLRSVELFAGLRDRRSMGVAAE